MVKRLSMLLLGGGVFCCVMSGFAFSAPVSGKGRAAVITTVPGQEAADLEARCAEMQQRTPGVGYYIHTIKMRENLWKLASKRGYSVHTIIGCNPELTTYEVAVGQRVLVPSKAGTLHRVLDNDTWDTVAKRYNVPTNDIKGINSGVKKLVPGDFVFIPGRRPDTELMNEGMRQKYEMHSLFVSPLGGRLSSFFGKRRHPVTGQRKLHAGIDIAVKMGTWVGAAAEGVVTVAGDGVGHYGKAVFIIHDDGYETHYGHLSRIYVRPGQRVKSRQLIARSGNTGRTTGPHLHFTIKKNGVPKDPLRYLW